MVNSNPVFDKVWDGNRHTSFELELATENVHQKLDHSVHWCQGVREQKESNHDRPLVEETKRLIQRLVVYEDRKERKDVEHMRLHKTLLAPVHKITKQDDDRVVHT